MRKMFKTVKLINTVLFFFIIMISTACTKDDKLSNFYSAEEAEEFEIQDIDVYKLSEILYWNVD